MSRITTPSPSRKCTALGCPWLHLVRLGRVEVNVVQGHQVNGPGVVFEGFFGLVAFGQGRELRFQAAGSVPGRSRTKV
jgi:hypothetical protein